MKISIDDLPIIPTAADTLASRKDKSKLNRPEKNQNEDNLSIDSKLPLTLKLTKREIIQELKQLRSRRAELQKKNSELEQLINDLKAELNEIENTSLPLKEARKLTYKALKKGRALQFLATVCTNNSLNFQLMKEGFEALVKNAFGSLNLIYRLKKEAFPATQAYSESNLRFYRQEQLILIAENDRLSQQVKSLQEQLTEIRIKEAKSADIKEINDKYQLVNSSNCSNSALTSYRSTKPKINDDAALPDEENVVFLDPDIVENKFNSLGYILSIATLRLQAYTFRRFSLNSQFDKFFQNTCNVSSSMVKMSCICHALSILSGIFKSHNVMQSCHCFWLLYINAHYCVEKREKEIYGKESIVINSSMPFRNYLNGTNLFNQNFNDRHFCTLRNSYSDTIFEEKGIPSAYVYEPYYFSNLPSSKTYQKRNVFLNSNLTKKNFSACLPNNYFPTQISSTDFSLRMSPTGCQKNLMKEHENDNLASIVESTEAKRNFIFSNHAERMFHMT